MDLQSKFCELASDIKKSLDEQADKVVEIILKKIEVNGVQPVTNDSILQLIRTTLASEDGPLARANQGIDAIMLRLNQMEATQAQAGTNGGVQEAANANAVNNGQIHYWLGVDDRIHRVPFGFKWPQGKSTRVMWDYWFFGDPNNGIGPFKFIEPKYDLTTASCKTRQCRTRQVMKALIDLAVAAGTIPNQAAIVSTNTNEVFVSSFTELMTILYPGNTERRTADFVCDVIYERRRFILEGVE